MVVVALLLVMVGVLTVIVARRADRDRIGRNTVAGIRSPSTMRTDQTWRIAHEAGGPATVAGGVFAIVLGVVAIVVELTGGSDGSVTWLVLGAVALLVVGVLVGASLGVRAARRSDPHA